MRTDAEYARELDRQDPLARFRDEFLIADPEMIYLDGNSLDRLPKRTVARLAEVVEQEWGRRLIRGWGEGWFTASQRIGARIALNILSGISPEEFQAAVLQGDLRRPLRHPRRGAQIRRTPHPGTQGQSRGR